MEDTSEKEPKDQTYQSVVRSQSIDPHDSSSTSSLSVFIDHNNTQNGTLQTPEIITNSPKEEDYTETVSMDEALKSEKAFIEFVMSFPSKDSSEYHRSVDSMSTKSKSPVPGSAATKVGLDHLDNLCKLMEQLSELRDTNCKLQRRVQYLEDLKTLHDMHKEITEGGQYCSEYAITSKPGPFELQKSATETHVCKKEDPVITNRSPSKYLSRRSRLQHTGGLRRERSKSVGHEDLGVDTKSKRLFPKWSKVKEAFGWESDRKESVKIKEERSLLSSPRRRSEESRQYLRHPRSPTWYDDAASLHSSLEEINREYDEENWKRSSIASEKYITLDIPSDGLKRQKSTPSPGSDKTGCYRDSSELKIKSATIERDSCRSQDFNKFDKEDSKRGKGPWGRVKTIIEKRRDSLKRRSLRRDYSTGDFESGMAKSPIHFTEAIDLKNYNEFLESSLKQEVTEEAVRKKRNKPGPIIFDQEVDYVCPRTPSSSPTFPRKSTWTKMKKVLTGKKEDERELMSLSTPASPESQHERNFTFDVADDLSKDIDNDGSELIRVGSENYMYQLSPTSPSSDLVLQLQRNLSEDFHRKLQEWDRIRGTGGATSCSPHCDHKPSIDITRSRKKSERDDTKNIKPKIKDLVWLEKELQKIEKEKQRLSKERQKYEERALRLEKLRETVLTANNSNKREVLVKTSAGEFRFEGISDAFTKKLYEWETKRGLGPELSTIALLDSSRLVVQPSMAQKNGHLQRVLSRSESSIADIGQPSHNSSNSLPSVKLADGMDIDKQNHSSRVNSEPDISTLIALKNGANISLTSSTRCIDNTNKNETAPEKIGSDVDYEKQRKDSETYYSLLEENVILLEQLKDKEEICRRLEKELEILDEKVDVMNVHHIQETERYRAKLWELHRQGATPRDVICCRQTMDQLKRRIDILERCTEKLRSDRETLEDSFRYHSKEQETMTLDLLGKMRELKAAGESKNGNDIDFKHSNYLETSTIERLQGLSALLMKQTQELEATLSEKTRQICQLKWELLHRDLSTVKLQTELHTHSAHKKRSKYAHLRSRSSEEASASMTQEPDSGESLTLSTDVFSCGTSSNEFKATHLANTVQQLSKEVMKLTSNAECLTFEDSKNATSSTNVSEIRNNRKSYQSLSKDELKKITVRRSSAENLSLVLMQKDDRNARNSSTDSDDSSDEYYTKVSWRPGVKKALPNTETERLLMSYGENPPRLSSQRKKKFQKVSKHNSSNCRKRSNTFHTNRDLAKPNLLDAGPQKCQSFRIARKNIEESVKGSPIDISLIRTLSNRLGRQNTLPEKLITNKNIDDVYLSKPDIDSKALEHLLLREISSDSKIPSLMQLQNCESNESNSANYPTRSMSEKHKSESAALKREYIQKKRAKKRLKSPDFSQSIKSNTALKNNGMGSYKHVISSTKDDSSQGHCDVTPQSVSHTTNTEIPTITIQLPKRKLRKASYSVENPSINDEQSITIVMPKKRSLSSEHESSSISDSSPRLPHSTESSKSDSTHLNKSTDTSLEDSNAEKTNSKLTDGTNANICLLKLVSLSKFESPFESDENLKSQNSFQSGQLKRKNEGNSAGSSPIAYMKNISFVSDSNSSRQILQSNSQDFNKQCKQLINLHPHYVKSPSAPQLDWRKACAKKSKGGAPNVKTLIEKYNQKVIESQVYKSPNTSNVSSPATVRKVSSPTQSCSSPVPYIPLFSSTPNTPIIYESLQTPPTFKISISDVSTKSPPSSPLSIARAEALRKAKEKFISSQTSLSLPSNFRSIDDIQKVGRAEKDCQYPALKQQDYTRLKGNDDDGMSCSSMDSTNLVMLRAGENCREMRMPKRTYDTQTSITPTEEKNPLKTSKSLSSSSLFKTVLSHDFKMPSSLLRLKRSKRKKDMGTVSQLCRQSLLLTDDDSILLHSHASHKSCPSSPDLKPKSASKSNWFQRNIFKHK